MSIYKEPESAYALYAWVGQLRYAVPMIYTTIGMEKH